MKKIFLLIVVVFLLASCSSFNKNDSKEIEPDDEDADTDVSVLPSYSLSDDQYKIILPFKPSAARGLIINQIHNRVDVDAMEEGLRRLSTETYDPEKYVYEEGQYITESMAIDWIDGLNPKIKKLTPGEEKDKDKVKKKIKEHQKNPRTFTHVLEQNYLQRTEDNKVKIVGVSLGIAVKSLYSFQVAAGGDTYEQKVSKSDALKTGKKVASQIVQDLRKDENFPEVPIFVTIYQEAEKASPVPGDFIAKTKVKKDSDSLGKWESITEEHVLFPSSHAKEEYNEDYQKFKAFSDQIEEYFPNYVGTIGTGFYIQKDMKRLSLNIPIEFYGQGEVLGFSQYVYGLVKETFSNHYDIEVTIESTDGAESLIYREAGKDEPIVHVYH